MKKATISSQRGAVLIFSLLMLLLITLMGVSMVQQNRMQFMMAANAQGQNQAFSGVENILLRAEEYVDNQRYADKAIFSCKKTVVSGKSIFTQLPVATTVAVGATTDTTKSDITSAVNTYLSNKTPVANSLCSDCKVEIAKTVCFSTQTNVSEDCSINTQYTDPLTGVTNYTYCYSDKVQDCSTEIYTLKATIVDAVTNVTRIVEDNYAVRCDS